MVKGRRPCGRRFTCVTELNVASLNLSVTYQVYHAELIAQSSCLARTVRPFPLVGTTLSVHKANPGPSLKWMRYDSIQTPQNSLLGLARIVILQSAPCMHSAVYPSDCYLPAAGKWHRSPRYPGSAIWCALCNTGAGSRASRRHFGSDEVGKPAHVSSPGSEISDCDSEIRSGSPPDPGHVTRPRRSGS